MTLDSKKRRERYWLDLVLGLLDDPSPVCVDCHERPDFQLAFGGRRIGVEVTELCDWRLEMRDSLSNRIVTRAAAEFDAAGGPPLWVSVLFSGPLRKADTGPMASVLAEYVRRNTPVRDGGSLHLSVGSDYWDEFPPSVESISIFRGPPVDESFWTAPDAAFVPSIGRAQLELVIDRKSKAAADYAIEFDATWLLLVIDGFRVGSTGNLTDDALRATYSACFDRILILRNRDTLHELNVAACEPNKRIERTPRALDS